MIQTRWWSNNGDTVSCGLCFRGCSLKNNTFGKCGVRLNENGSLVSPYLGRFCARAVDPVEKKPLFRWKPGSLIYSLGSFGCTMDCPFCQNSSIARPTRKYNPSSIPELSIQELVAEIKALGLNSVAFTYNEPTLQAEYICEASPVLHEAGIAIALVTNGAMSSEAAGDLLSCLEKTDAANIDIKAFTQSAYGKLGGDLETVKSNIKSFVEAGIHVELTNLVVPEINDNAEEFESMVEWIALISREIPLHVTRYFPARNYNEPPTKIELLKSFANIAREKLNYVYIGNI